VDEWVSPMRLDVVNTLGIDVQVSETIETEDMDDAQKNVSSKEGYRTTLRSSRIIILPLRKYSIYDSPWLLALLSSIRRQTNKRRLANVPCHDPCCIFVSRRPNPFLERLFRLVDLGIFSLCFRMASSRLEKVSQNLEELKRPVPAVETEALDLPKRVYRYSLLDLLQGKAGRFSVRPLGTRAARAETRKRELKAIIPYRGGQKATIPIPQLWETAILTAFCALQQYRETEHLTGTDDDAAHLEHRVDYVDDAAHLERGGIDEAFSTKRLSTKMKRRLENQSEEYDSSSRSPGSNVHTFSEHGNKNVRNQRSSTKQMHGSSYDHSIPRHRKRAIADCQDSVALKKSQSRRTKKLMKRSLASDDLDQEQIKKRLRTSIPYAVREQSIESQNREEKAKAKELSLLQRFGLNVSKDSKRDPEETMHDSFGNRGEDEKDSDDTGYSSKENSQAPDSNSRRSDFPCPPLRCGSPSSLDRTLKRRQASDLDRIHQKRRKPDDALIVEPDIGSGQPSDHKVRKIRGDYNESQIVQQQKAKGRHSNERHDQAMDPEGRTTRIVSRNDTNKIEDKDGNPKRLDSDLSDASDQLKEDNAQKVIYSPPSPFGPALLFADDVSVAEDTSRRRERMIHENLSPVTGQRSADKTARKANLDTPTMDGEIGFHPLAVDYQRRHVHSQVSLHGRKMTGGESVGPAVQAESRGYHDGSIRVVNNENVAAPINVQMTDNSRLSYVEEQGRKDEAPVVGNDILPCAEVPERERKRMRKETKKARKKEKKERKKQKKEKRARQMLTSKQTQSQDNLQYGRTGTNTNAGVTEAALPCVNKAERVEIPVGTPAERASRGNPPDGGKYESHSSGKVKGSPKISAMDGYSMQKRSNAREGCDPTAGTVDGSSLSRQQAPVQLLCSETFLETWGEMVAKLANGEWAAEYEPTYPATIRSSRPIADAKRICFFDTSLLDFCGVDIETPNRGGIIVSSLSSWQQSGVSDLLKRIVELSSISRYRSLEVFLCADIDPDLGTTNEITRLQNAVLRQKGKPPSVVCLTLVSPRSIAACIAHSVLMQKGYNEDVGEMETWVSDDRTRERLLFLLSVIPTLTVGGALQCLALSGQGPHEDGSESWFKKLLAKKENERKRLEANARSNKQVHSDLHPDAMMQLSFALNAFLGKENASASM
jgi:hypothetical protein